MIASVAGLTAEEFILVAQALAAAGADLIEVNLNDPHVHSHLAPFASAKRLGQLVSTIRQAVHAPLAVKLPMTVPLPLVAVTAALLDSNIQAAICHNTSANGDSSQAQAILHASTGRLDIIGVGGVSSGAEALAILRSGIKAIQIGSVVVKEGVGVFARLKRELADSLESRV